MLSGGYAAPSRRFAGDPADLCGRAASCGRCTPSGTPSARRGAGYLPVVPRAQAAYNAPDKEARTRMDHPPDWFDRVPKVELHLHLEGAIPFDTLWDLLVRYGGDPEVPTPDALRRRFVYGDFAGFIRAWVWKSGFLRSYEDMTRIAEGVARNLAAQNVRYAEVFFSPSDQHERWGLEEVRVAEAIRAGLARVPAVRVGLIVDTVRDDGPAVALRTLDGIGEAARDLGVIGLGMGGSEHPFPPEPFAPVYARARALGLHTTAHAGEAAGPESVWGALRALGAERIGHGTRAAEDPALVDYLAAQQVPLEMCPLSNVSTRVVPDLAHHPIRRYVDAGLLVTVSTDDPTMFGNTLAGEYRGLASELGFTNDGIRALILAAVEASWLSPAEKDALRATLEGDANWPD